MLTYVGKCELFYVHVPIIDTDVALHKADISLILRRGRGNYRKAAPTWRAHHQKDVVGMCWIAALPILMKYLKKKVWTGLAIRVLDSETA